MPWLRGLNVFRRGLRRTVGEIARARFAPPDPSPTAGTSQQPESGRSLGSPVSRRVLPRSITSNPRSICRFLGLLPEARVISSMISAARCAIS